MRIYNLAKNVIRRGDYEYNEMRLKLTAFSTVSMITTEQYMELIDMLVNPDAAE